MKHEAIILFLCLVLSGNSIAQNWGGSGQASGQAPKGKIIGKISDAENGQTVEYATIALYSVRDSSLVAGTISNEKGEFEMEARYGFYFVKIEFISYQPKVIPGIKLTPKNPLVDLGKLNISPTDKMLSEVEVTAEKGQVQMMLDKKIINVSKDIANIGGSAIDVLENAPSVSIDIDGNINLRGSTNVRLLIDGKPSGLTGISSADILEQFPANTIDRIEIITNPSVRYDAEGMAGIINIILKKERKRGLNGLINLTAGIPDDHTGTINFNYGKKKINLFGSYSARFRERPGEVSNKREITINDTTTYSDQDGTFTRGGLSHNIRLGSDIHVTKKNTLTGSVHLRISDSNNGRFTEYSDYDQDKTLTNYYTRNQEENDADLSLDYNLAFLRTFNKEHTLSIDSRYSNSNEDETATIEEAYFDPDLSPSLIPSLLQRINEKESQSTILLQADYIRPVGAEGKIEMGIKSTFKEIDKDYLIEEMDSASDWVDLVNLSNHFIYQEEVHAGYAMYGSKKKKFSYQVGLRVEQTNITSTLVSTDEIFKKNYLGFFPSVHISKEMKKGNKMQWSYSRRIRRPSFWSLNPFTSYADPMNLWIGNPDLNPEYTHSGEVNYIKYWEKGNISSGVYYKHADDVIQRIRQVDSLGISITRPENLSSQESFGLEFTFFKQLAKWWKINGSCNYYRRIVDGGNLGAGYASDFYSWTGRANTSISFWKDASIQVMFNYRAPRETVQGTRKSMYFADAAIKKDILKRKGSISFKVRDIFNSRKYEGEYEQDGLKITSLYRRGVRVYMFSFNYTINRYKQERKRNGYNYEESEGMGM